MLLMQPVFISWLVFYGFVFTALIARMSRLVCLTHVDIVVACDYLTQRRRPSMNYRGG